MTIRSLIRSPIRSLVSSALGGGGGLLGQATSQLGGVAPYHYWDFINNRALFAQADVGGVTSTPGWSFTRASTGYAETAAGVLVPFASGALRRTDKGVLIEGARTNLILRSQEFDNASWTKRGTATITANASNAPDGTLTADRITGLNSASNDVFQSVTVADGVAFSPSIYIKKVTTTGLINIANPSDATRGSWNVDLAVLGAGWERITRAHPAVSVVAEFTGSVANGGGVQLRRLVSGLVDLDVWGAQSETSAFPSSYIPTTSASATRAADVLTVASPGVNYPLGMFAEFERTTGGDGGTTMQGVITLQKTNQNAQLMVNTTAFSLRGVVVAGTSQVDAISGALTNVGVPYKSAARIQTNDWKSALGGSLAGSDATITLPEDPTSIDLGNRGAGFSPLFGYLRRVAIFNFAPTDAQLQAMTT